MLLLPKRLPIIGWINFALAHSFCGFFYPEPQKRVFKNKVYAGFFIIFLSCLPDFDYFMGMFAENLKAWPSFAYLFFFFPFDNLYGQRHCAKLMKKFLSPFILTTSLMSTHILLDFFSTTILKMESGSTYCDLF